MSDIEGQLSVGSIVQSTSGENYDILGLLGSGGQGEVYKVIHDGTEYALKWYFPHTATPIQKVILENLIKKGTPSPSFLWPLDLVSIEGFNSFGYIMPLRSKKFMSIVDLVKRKAEPNFYHLIKAAFQLTLGYNKLHTMGYCYSDISFGNVFFNPQNGDVLICDNDNVSVNNSLECTVFGTPRFMAPEIVLGLGRPSRNTDLYSLAVLLFYMLTISHPLEGKLEAGIKCMDLPAMVRLYGEDPVFIFNPKDDRNRPVERYQSNPLIYWPIYPQLIKDLFIESFTKGLKSPNRRVTELRWLEALGNCMSGIFFCPKCGAEIFYDETKARLEVYHECWNCQSKVASPTVLVIERNRVVLRPQSTILEYHINGAYENTNTVGEVVQNPKNPNLWGILNKSSENWTYTKPDGTIGVVPPGKSVSIIEGLKLNFGTSTGFIL